MRWPHNSNLNNNLTKFYSNFPSLFSRISWEMAWCSFGQKFSNIETPPTNNASKELRPSHSLPINNATSTLLHSWKKLNKWIVKTDSHHKICIFIFIFKSNHTKKYASIKFNSIFPEKENNAKKSFENHKNSQQWKFSYTYFFRFLFLWIFYILLLHWQYSVSI